MGTLESRGGPRTSATTATGSLLPRPGRPSTPHPLPPGATPAGETTAEIPVVAGPRAGWATGARHEKAYSVLLPDGTLWYGSSKRLPAPFALRLLVWLLVFVLVVAGAGLAVEHEHPSWLQFLQNAPSAPSSSRSGSAPSSTAAGARSAGGLQLVSSKAGAVTYTTGTSSFTIVLSFSHPVWTVVASPAGSKSLLVETVLQPSQSPKVVPVQGSASVEVSAAADSIKVSAGHKTLGTISDPKVETIYSFLPEKP